MIKVKKRNGKLENFNISKVEKVIKWACEGLDVDQALLQRRFDQFLFDGITTEAIQDNLIEHSKQLATAHTPDWVFVAGRLRTMNRWATTGAYKVGFKKFVKTLMKDKYKHPAISLYSDKDLELLGSYINQDNDLNHSFASVVSAESKYLMNGECIQQMMMVNAMIIASVEKPEKRVDTAIELYVKAFSPRKVSLASPWWMYLREYKNISSCFILAMNDDLGSIYDNAKNFATISKYGGGCGAFFGKIRAAGSNLMGKSGGSKGVCGWVKLFNDTAVFVDQGGKRAGAVTVALPVWHADIEQFLDLQTEAGDQRNKAYDVKLQVTIPDLFMELKGEIGDGNNNDWYTFCPHEVEQVLGFKIYDLFGDEFKEAYYQCVQAHSEGKLKVVHIYKAKELFKKIMKVALETGMPYLPFTCEINRRNPNKHEGNIYCVNLCVESFSVFDADNLIHTCNLASPVVGRIDLDEIEYIAGLTVRILDNGIDLTDFPLDESTKHNERYRTIGVGLLGLHDLLAREYKSYFDEDFINEYMDRLTYGCVKASVELAKERGAYPAFKGSMWDTGEMTSHYASISKNPQKWYDIQKEIDKYGIRNSQLQSPAPNTSTAIFMDAAAGIMPVYSAFFYEDNKDGKIPTAAMHLKDNPLSYAKDLSKYKPYDLTKVTGWIQQWVDTGVSAEYLMNKNEPDFDATYLFQTFNDAWKNKNKAVYYIRTLKQGESLVQQAEDCIGCAG